MGESIKRKAFSSTIWKFLERIGAQGVSMIVTIILARLLTPEDYSVTGIVAIFFAFANIFISGGFNTALIQKKDADSKDYSSVLYLSLFASVVIYLVLFFGSPIIAQIYKQPILVPVFRVMGLVLPVNAFKSILCAYISSKLEFRKFFFATLGGTIFSAFVGIYMAMKGYGPWALVAQQMSNSVIDTLILCLTTPIKLSLKISFKRIATLFQYGGRLLLSSIIGFAYTQSIPLVIGMKFSGADLSFYTKGRNFPDMILSSTTNTFSAVLFPVLAKVQDDKKLLLRYTRLYIRLTSYIVFPLMLGLFIVAKEFVLILLTEKWLPAVNYIRIFCVASMFDMIHVGNCETIKAMGRSDIYLKIEIIKKVSYFLVIAVFLVLSTTPITTAMAFVVCTLIAIVVNAIPNIKLIGYNLKDQLVDIFYNLIGAGLMCVAVSLVNILNLNVVATFIVKVATGIVFYVAFGFVTKNEAFFYLLRLIKRKG